jgi:hypothetical protein
MAARKRLTSKTAALSCGRSHGEPGPQRIPPFRRQECTIKLWDQTSSASSRIAAAARDLRDSFLAPCRAQDDHGAGRGDSRAGSTGHHGGGAVTAVHRCFRMLRRMVQLDLELGARVAAAHSATPALRRPAVNLSASAGSRKGKRPICSTWEYLGFIRLSSCQTSRASSNFPR